MKYQIDCNALPKDHGLKGEVHDKESLIGILNSLDHVKLVKYHYTRDTVVLNSNVLDYLLEHPEDIPQNWDISKGIVFLGTSHYDEENGELSHRGLCWKNGDKENGLSWFTVNHVRLMRNPNIDEVCAVI